MEGMGCGWASCLLLRLQHAPQHLGCLLHQDRGWMQGQRQQEGLAGGREATTPWALQTGGTQAQLWAAGPQPQGHLEPYLPQPNSPLLQHLRARHVLCCLQGHVLLPPPLQHLPLSLPLLLLTSAEVMVQVKVKVKGQAWMKMQFAG